MDKILRQKKRKTKQTKKAQNDNLYPSDSLFSSFPNPEKGWVGKFITAFVHKSAEIVKSFHYYRVHCGDTPYVCVWLVALLRAWGGGSCKDVSLLLWLLSQPAPGSSPCVVGIHYYVYLALNAPVHLWCPRNQTHWVPSGFGTTLSTKSWQPLQLLECIWTIVLRNWRSNLV